MRAMLRTRTVLLVVGTLGVGLVFAPGSAIGATLQQVFIANDAAHPVPVAGSVNVGNLPATQPVSGSVNVGNLPATQPVSGSVSVSNLPATQPVSGTVNVGAVSGAVAVIPAVPASTRSAGTGVQSLEPGAEYTYLDANYAMAVTSVSIWTHQLIEVAFAGDAPLVLTTDEPQALALTQPNVTGNSVKVTCLASVRCQFAFHVLGS